MKQWLWPDIDDIDSAKKVAYNGAGTAFFIAFVTALITFLQTQGYIKLFILGREAYIDAGLFLVIGTGIFFMSRIAAVAGLLLYVAEQYFMIKSGAGRGSLVMILFTLFFLAAVRATFVFHGFKKREKQPEPAPGPVSALTGQPVPAEAGASPAAPAEAAPKKSWVPGIIIGLVVILILGGAGWWFGRPFLEKRRGAGSSKTTEPEPADNSSRTFHMKNGETVRGRVIQEDPLYYVVKRGKKEDVLVREDIASVE